MHLPAADTERIDDGEAAVDLGQPPGDIVILSSADSELLTLDAAASRLSFDLSVRLANLGRLSHPLSVDLYIEKTLAQSKLVVVRMMGGEGYWPYGLDRLRALARGGGPKLVVVPGEDRWDRNLEAFFSVSPEAARSLWRYLAEGGATNCERALRFMAHLLGRGGAPPAPEVIPRAGCTWPGEGPVTIERLRERLDPALPFAPIVFYRAYVLGALTAPIDALAEALARAGINPVPVFVASLKDRESEDFLDELFAALPPAIVLNTTAFAVSSVGGAPGTVLDRPGRPVLQVVLAGTSEEAWRQSTRGLPPRDLTMNVVLPEVDGRILTRAVSFKAETLDAASGNAVTEHRPLLDRIDFVVRQAKAWIDVAAKPTADRRVAIVLSNYPNRDGRLANGVGLDTPASAAVLGRALREAGYRLNEFPETGRALIAHLLGGVTNALNSPSFLSPRRQPGSTPSGRQAAAALMDSGFRRNDGGKSLSLQEYQLFFNTLPLSVRKAMAERWGAPEDDPFFIEGAFRLPAHRFGNVVVGVQPSRGYDIDPKATYHDPDLVPPHRYLAFYAWLRRDFGADAVVHLGKHGNLEWLPGKALGLSETCWPEIALGTTPLIYPFIVNDPGEGSQAKRRLSAVIVDHLMPAMTRAEIHGSLAELETLIDEYYLAAGVDRRRRAYLQEEIIAAAERHGLDRDLGIVRGGDEGEALRALDAHLCELKEMQIRDGLHVLGQAPADRQRIDTLVAIARGPRSGGRPADASLHRALAVDLGFGDFDPLDCDLAAAWEGPRPGALAGVSEAPWRTCGDTVERIEMLAGRLVEEAITSSPHPLIRHASRAILSRKGRGLGVRFNAEANSLLPGSISSVPQAPDPLSLRERVASPPTSAVADVGRESSEVGNTRLRVAEPGEGEATRAVLDWIAKDLAPAVDASGHAEISSVLAALDGRFVQPGPSGAPTRGRPDVLPTGRNFYSVDVRAVPTAAAWALGRQSADALALRYFQDEGEWPRSIAISAWGTSNMRTGGDDIAQVMALIGARPVREPGTGRVTGFTVIPLSDLGRPRIDVTLRISGMFRDAFPTQIDLIDSAMRAVAALDEPVEANPLTGRRTDPRIFGAKPGSYGAGLQVLIDEGIWETRGDFAEAFLAWGGFAYGGGAEGETARDTLAERLAEADAVFQAQDNREHDILDSDDYYQFQGGLAATVETLKGSAPRVYHGDTSRPEKPVVRALSEEIARVVRGRAANPKWIAGVMRHGYKGAFEMAATVDYLFAYAATTHAVGDHHFDQLFDAYIADDRVRDFIAENNPPALAEMAARLREAIDRGLWAPRTNSAHDRLSALAAGEIRKEAAE